MKEEIRIITWTNGRYGVSNLGNVYSYYNTRGNKIDKPLKLNPSTNQYGYSRVALYYDNKRKSVTVHRLVAEMFIPNPNNLSQVNHKNEIKTDNRVENLEWCDAKYNNNYGTHRARVSAAQKVKPFAQYDKYGNIIKRFRCINESIPYLKLSKGAISQMLNGKITNRLNLHYI